MRRFEKEKKKREREKQKAYNKGRNVGKAIQREEGGEHNTYTQAQGEREGTGRERETQRGDAVRSLLFHTFFRPSLKN